MKRLSLSPAFALFLLSPAVGELLSGSAPPLEFFNPLAFAFLASLYGSGAVVVRELRVRWNRDFRSVLLLGGAYGILEEGLLVKSFFDPNWVDLGVLGSFGRWADVNWVWSEMLIIYHAVFSIAIPILLVELVYPQRREERWVGNRGFAFFVVLLVVDTVFGFFVLTDYRPPLLQYLLAVVGLGLFALAAYKLPTRKRVEGIGGGKTLFAAGCLASTAFFILFWVGPHVIANPMVVMLLGVVLLFVVAGFLGRFDWNNPLSAVNRLAVVAGALSFLIFLAFLHELNPSMRGMSLVGVASVVLLLRLKGRLKGHG